MRSRRMLLFISFLFTTLLVCPSAAQSAMPAYMSIEGQNQGRIEGSCTIEGREGMIVVYSFGHNIRVPYDQQTRLITGRRAHAPFELLKEVDKSSPLLYRAMINNERLSNVRIKFYRIGPTHLEEHYFTITLINANIVKIAPSATSFPKEAEGLKPMEILSFTYERIQWCWEPGQITSEDEWRESGI
ncbi:MAG: Hcp family type VI secretion system effector [bacterium]